MWFFSLSENLLWREHPVKEAIRVAAFLIDRRNHCVHLLESIVGEEYVQGSSFVDGSAFGVIGTVWLNPGTDDLQEFSEGEVDWYKEFSLSYFQSVVVG